MTGSLFSQTIRMEIILNGILSGIVLAFLIGPVFFTIIQTSIEKGFRCGMLVAIGVSLSDAFYITIVYLGITHIIENEAFRAYFGYAGGLILAGFGMYYLLIKSRRLVLFDFEPEKVTGVFRYIAKGFIINGMSPMVLIFWIGTVGVAAAKFGYHEPSEAILFFSAIVSTVFLTDVLKAKLADKLRHLLTPRFIRLMNIILGVVLVVFAGRLIFFSQELVL